MPIDNDRSVIDHSLDTVGRFRKQVQNKDSLFKPRNAVDPATGEKTRASVNHPGMNYARPVQGSGKPTRYFQVMMEIVANPGITRKEVLNNLYPKEARVGLASRHPTDIDGYLGSYFADFSADGFTRTTTKGEIYPTKKLVDYVKSHIGEVDEAYISEDYDYSIPSIFE